MTGRPRRSSARSIRSTAISSTPTPPAVVASTASPFKFCDSVLGGLGVQPEGQGLELLDQLSRVSGEPVPAPLACLRSKQVRFTQSVEKDRMVDAVLSVLR